MDAERSDQRFWAAKPWWCQPWSIVLTGVALPLSSWLVLHKAWISLPIAAAVLLWWWTFLVVVPNTASGCLDRDSQH